jgi:hypothetical protein
MEPEHDQRGRPNEARHDLTRTLCHSERSEQSPVILRGISSELEMFALLKMRETFVKNCRQNLIAY